MHYHTKQSKKLRKLRERPRLAKEMQLPEGGQLRNLMEKLRITNKRGDWGLTGGKTNCIYYLIGDERRAARLFVEENTTFVKKCFEKETSTPLQKTNEFMRELILQEYEIMEYNDEL